MQDGKTNIPDASSARIIPRFFRFYTFSSYSVAEKRVLWEKSKNINQN
jgi:hypothetical protein